MVCVPAAIAMTEPTPPYTSDQLSSDDVSKKDLVLVLQEHGSLEVPVLIYL